MSGIPFPPKPWTDGQTFEYEQDGTTITGKYNASSNAWTFTRSYPGASTGQITTATVLAMNERPPAMSVSPFSDAYQGTETQQDINWFLFDDIEATVRYSNDEPSADNFVNRFWWDSNTEVLYVWDGGKWQLSSPNAASENVLQGFVLDASGGMVNETGNLVIKNDPDTPDSGRLYISDENGDSKFTIFSSGSVETKNSISFAGTNTNKNIRAYGVTNPNLRFMVGPNSDNLFEMMTIDSNFVKIKEQFRAEKTSSFAGTMTLSGELLAQDDITCSGNVECQQLKVSDELEVIEDATMRGGVLIGGRLTTTDQIRAQSTSANSTGLAIYATDNNNNGALAKQPGMMEFVTGSTTPSKYTGIIVSGNSGSPVWSFGMGVPGSSIVQFEERSMNTDGLKTWKIYPTYNNSTDGATPATLDWVRENGNGLPENWQAFNSSNPMGNTDLTGTSWYIRMAENSTTGIMVLNLDNGSTNLTTNMVLGFPPNEYMPKVTTTFECTDSTGQTSGTVVIEPTTGAMRLRTITGPPATKVQGQLIYTKKN